MTDSRTIPESLHDPLVELYGEVDPTTNRRRGYRELSAWLKSEHQLDASREAVRRVVEPLRRERQEIRRDVLREAVSQTLPRQLEQLDDLLVKIAADANSAKPIARGKLVDVYRKVLQVKFRAAGLDRGDDKVTLTGTPQTLAEFLGGAFSEDAPDPMEE